ncbi:hypothetical protein GJ744_004326 [Endocarpon pusillum]|uniref:Uncharacterized protein n=1 Tax=Endocarpon pusillum TaxID=364733 RepID=A0A8H7DXL1_9EURO|nr:hypothetical protein GJ744_004326 [Endocarpon pusillum]
MTGPRQPSQEEQHHVCLLGVVPLFDLFQIHIPSQLVRHFGTKVKKKVIFSNRVILSHLISLQWRSRAWRVPAANAMCE